jgi:hypothetical protein
MPNETCRYRLCGDVRFRRVADEGIVLRQTQGEVLVLNGVGLRVLELAGSGAAMADLLASMTAEYQVEMAELQTDVSGFLQELVGSGVLEPAGDGLSGATS